MRFIALIALIAISAPFAATAGDGCGAEDAVLQIFDGADQNQDGSLTRAEYEAAGLQEYGVSFDESDADSSGETSMSEYLELYQRHHPPVQRREA